MALTFQSLQPVITLVIKDLQISYARAGFLIGLFSLPGVFFSILTGLMADKYGSKKLLALSLLLMISGSLTIALGNTYYLIGLGRFMSGLGALATSIIVPLVISQWFLGKELGLAMSVFNSGVPLGVLLSFNIMPRLALIFGWRSSPLFTASFALMTLIIFFLVFKEHRSQEEKKNPAGQRTFTLKMGYGIWIIGMAWMFHTGSVSAFLSFSTDFLVKNGIPITVAGFSSGLISIGNLIFTPIVGILIDRFHSQKQFIAIGGIVAATFYILILNYPALSMPLIFFLGFVSAFIPASVFTLVPYYIMPERRGTAYGIISTSANTGNTVSPYIAGFLMDFSGHYKLSFWFLSFLSTGCMLAISALALKKFNRVKQKL